MSGGHAHHQLYLDRETAIHRLAPQCKIAAVLVFVIAVVATPRETDWPYAVYALALLGVAAVARVPALVVVRRMVVEIPFVIFALLLPIIARGPRVDVLGVSLSANGLESAFILLAKGTLGVVASILLAATTRPRDLLLGLQRLRMPETLVQIMTFMFRYVEVVLAEMTRMRIARESRGFQARHAGHLRVLANSAGALFIRSYERGERVHLAMLSRGYVGRMPVLVDVRSAPSQWAVAALLPLVAVATTAAAWVIR
ncbi:MAG: cobalt ECF transporter T component CbiQ [Geodermatophilaceae bacterium]|nr:cobalt ECF transporter T component CbiQ [Geodermatophilaceae bacterium]MDQ3465214.1 cobalt ECF transporter T component CbiQ [Actinomycetota bacterium]